MNTAEQRVESQVQFWSLLGPFLLLAATSVLIYKMTSHWYFPVSALIGTPLCVKWKMKGLAGALGTLLLLSLFSYQDLDLEERYWHVGMSLAMAFSFVILTLSSEEVEGVITKLKNESQSRLENFLRLDETAKKDEQVWIEEKALLTAQLGVLNYEIGQVKDDKQVLHRLAQLGKDELIQIREQHDSLLKELYYKKLQIAQLNERLDESELTIQNFVDSAPQKRIEALTEEIETANQMRLNLEELIKKLGDSAEMASMAHEEHRTTLEMEIGVLREELTNLANEKKQADEDWKHRYTALEENKNQLTNGKNEIVQILNEQSKAFEAERDSLRGSFAIEMENLRAKYENEKERMRGAFESERENLQKRIDCQENEYRELKQELEQKQAHLESAYENLSKIEENKAKLPYGPGNTRPIEAMYIQLKKQFEEKSAILDQTRRELFCMQEKCEGLERQLHEEENYSLSELEEGWQKEYQQLNVKYEKLKAQYKEEVDALEQLVSQLMGKD